MIARARCIALANGVRYAYTGNGHDRLGGSTYRGACGELVVERDRCALGTYDLTGDGRCRTCDAPLPDVFAGPPGAQGRTCQPVRLASLGR